TRWTTFWRITFPLVLPGVIGAGLFGFTLSYDEFARSLFATGPEQTLPLVIYAQFDRQLQPTLYAIGTMTTIVSLGAVTVFAVLFRLVRRRTTTWGASKAPPSPPSRLGDGPGNSGRSSGFGGR